MSTAEGPPGHRVVGERTFLRVPLATPPGQGVPGATTPQRPLQASESVFKELQPFSGLGLPLCGPELTVYDILIGANPGGVSTNMGAELPSPPKREISPALQQDACCALSVTGQFRMTWVPLTRCSRRRERRGAHEVSLMPDSGNEPPHSARELDTVTEP